MGSGILAYLKQNALMLVGFALIGFYLYTHEPGVMPAIDSPLKSAAIQYRKTLPQTYKAAGDAVKAGTVATKGDLINFVDSRSAGPMHQSLDAAIAPGLGQAKKPSDDQPIINSAIVSQAMYDIADGVK
jgi:hypothetical protein